MSECKNVACTEQTAEAYNWNYCSSTCEIMTLRYENKDMLKNLKELEGIIDFNSIGEKARFRLRSHDDIGVISWLNRVVAGDPAGTS